MELLTRSACLIFIFYTRYIDIETGRRSDTAHHYIYNQDHNKNLKVLVRHRVVRVIFEYVVFLLVYSRIINFISAGVLVQSELNMLTIQLGEQRELLSHS
jgi:effector-binding domain-containing protein